MTCLRIEGLSFHFAIVRYILMGLRWKNKLPIRKSIHVVLNYVYLQKKK